MGNTIKTIIDTDDVAVNLVISDENRLETAAIEQLKKVSELNGMRLCVGMPDIHPGKGQPIGALFMSEKFFISA